MGVCDCGRETVWKDMCELCNNEYKYILYLYDQPIEVKPVDKKTCRIENVYRVWDCINGGSITIQEGDAGGVIAIGSEQVTVEQIPGIIEVLNHLKDDYERKNPGCLPKEIADHCKNIVENACSGRSDPPF